MNHCQKRDQNRSLITKNAHRTITAQQKHNATPRALEKSNLFQVQSSSAQLQQASSISSTQNKVLKEAQKKPLSDLILDVSVIDDQGVSDFQSELKIHRKPIAIIKTILAEFCESLNIDFLELTASSQLDQVQKFMSFAAIQLNQRIRDTSFSATKSKNDLLDLQSRFNNISRQYETSVTSISQKDSYIKDLEQHFKTVKDDLYQKQIKIENQNQQITNMQNQLLKQQNDMDNLQNKQIIPIPFVSKVASKQKIKLDDEAFKQELSQQLLQIQALKISFGVISQNLRNESKSIFRNIDLSDSLLRQLMFKICKLTTITSSFSQAKIPSINKMNSSQPFANTSASDLQLNSELQIEFFDLKADNERSRQTIKALEGQIEDYIAQQVLLNKDVHEIQLQRDQLNIQLDYQNEYISKLYYQVVTNDTQGYSFDIAVSNMVDYIKDHQQMSQKFKELQQQYTAQQNQFQQQTDAMRSANLNQIMVIDRLEAKIQDFEYDNKLSYLQLRDENELLKKQLELLKKPATIERCSFSSNETDQSAKRFQPSLSESKLKRMPSKLVQSKPQWKKQIIIPGKSAPQIAKIVACSEFEYDLHIISILRFVFRSDESIPKPFLQQINFAVSPLMQVLKCLRLLVSFIQKKSIAGELQSNASLLFFIILHNLYSQEPLEIDETKIMKQLFKTMTINISQSTEQVKVDLLKLSDDIVQLFELLNQEELTHMKDFCSVSRNVLYEKMEWLNQQIKQSNCTHNPMDGVAMSVEPLE